MYNVFTPERSLSEFKTPYVEKIFIPINVYFLVLLCRYFVFNFVDYDLNKVILRRIPFAEDYIRLIIYSLLRGLKV